MSDMRPFELPHYPGRLGVMQRVLPAYRVAFFDTLAELCAGGMSVFAGQPGPGEAIAVDEGLQVAHFVPARNVHIGRVTSPFYLCWQRGLLGWLQEWQPDVLVAEANPRYLGTRLAAGWMRAQGRPVLGWGLGVAPQRPAPGAIENLRSPGRQRFLSLFDGLIAYSTLGAESYRAAGFPPEGVFVAPNAVSAAPQGPPPERPAQFTGEPVFLYVGRLQARKRLDNLLRACATLSESATTSATSRPRLWIVGEGPSQDSLQELAVEIYPQTEFFGARHGADLEPLFAAADLFVLPGTGGLAVQQAMAHGLPVVAAEGDGTLDDLLTPGAGWRVPPDDVPALAAALAAGIADVGRLRQMGREAYRIVAEEVNIERMAAAFVKAAIKISSEIE